MREIFLALCAIAAIVAVATAKIIVSSETPPRLLGANECTWGPSYWCQNIETASGCKATQHCIKNVWETMKVKDDKDSVCGICKDMVKQARDQLESNQTQQDLKAVFEGSCALIHIKPIIKECDRLVDQFIPELVETLASQMDPSVVCSVAGLCNSAYIDKLLKDNKKLLPKNPIKTKFSMTNDELKPDECSKCYTIASHMEGKFKTASRDNVLDRMLKICGHMGSYSDACSSIVIENFATIYSHLRDNFRARNICHLSGQCVGKFHNHDESGEAETMTFSKIGMMIDDEDDVDAEDINVEIRPLSSVGMVEVNDDLPCKLCQQLVGHLRDLLVANTTEVEFEHVLEGLCKQTKSFADECKSIVDEYYPAIYHYLINGLDTNGVCQMASICPSPGKTAEDGPIWPLLPEKSVASGKLLMKERKNLGMHGAGIRKDKTEAEEMQLPVDRLMGPSMISGLPRLNSKGEEVCEFCEYLLHYLQQVITNPTTEEDVKNVIGRVCRKLPTSVTNTCDEFIKEYGDALVAILAQNIDPSVICPKMGFCASPEFLSAWKKIPKDMMIKSEIEDKPSCPLCLLAVGQLYSVIKDDKTEARIEMELKKLCAHFPKSLVEQCDAFVEGYSKELVNMLIADMTPQEICVYIKLCDANDNPGPKNLERVSKDGEIMTNEIPDYPMTRKVEDNTKCVVCEFIMRQIEKTMSDNNTRDEIENVVHTICDHLPRTISKECNSFVDQYADIVIAILSEEVSPREICTILNFCQENMQRLHDSVAECALCQGVVSVIDNVLANPKVDVKIEDVVSHVCDYLAAAKHEKCKMMMKIYEQSIINILRESGETKKICKKIDLCTPADFFATVSMQNTMNKSAPAKKLRKKHFYKE